MTKAIQKLIAIINIIFVYIIHLYRALFLQKGLSAIINYCHLSRMLFILQYVDEEMHDAILAFFGSSA